MDTNITQKQLIKKEDILSNLPGSAAMITKSIVKDKNLKEDNWRLFIPRIRTHLSQLFKKKKIIKKIINGVVIFYDVGVE